jgi:hypothetical protein
VKVSDLCHLDDCSPIETDLCIVGTGPARGSSVNGQIGAYKWKKMGEGSLFRESVMWRKPTLTPPDELTIQEILRDRQNQKKSDAESHPAFANDPYSPLVRERAGLAVARICPGRRISTAK